MIELHQLHEEVSTQKCELWQSLTPEEQEAALSWDGISEIPPRSKAWAGLKQAISGLDISIQAGAGSCRSLA